MVRALYNYLEHQRTVVLTGCCTERACYPSVVLFVCGSVLEGAAFQLHLHIAVLVVGWVLAQMAVMMNTSAICECWKSRYVFNDGLLTDPIL